MRLLYRDCCLWKIITNFTPSCSCVYLSCYFKVKFIMSPTMCDRLAYCLQLSDLTTGTCVLLTMLRCGRWVTIVSSWWISLTLMIRSSLRLLALLLDVSRGYRDITSSRFHNHVTGMISCLNFSLVEVSVTSSRSSKFSPKISRTWCLCWRRTEVRDFIESVHMLISH